MEIPRHWRMRKQRYQLAGAICQQCENMIFPPRAVCVQCNQGWKVSQYANDAVAMPETMIAGTARVK